MRRSIATGVVVALMMIAGASRADVVPLDVDACRNKTAGGACSYATTTGVCQDATCSKLDYANWDRDASSSPPTVQYACLRCVAGIPLDDDHGLCAMGGGRSTASRVAPWLLAGAFSSLLLVARRRRRRR